MGGEPRNPLLKIVEFDTSHKLCAMAVDAVIPRLLMEPHDGWADLTVHQSQLRPAMKLAREHNARKPRMQLSVQCIKAIGMDEWWLSTKAVQVRVQWEKAPK